MTFDVFISYSSKDKQAADATCAALETAGIRCWIAPRDVRPGRDYATEIVEAIETCRIMVVIVSGNSNESRQVPREVEQAVRKGVPVIPMRIEDVTLNQAMEYFLDSIHWLDAITPPLAKHLEFLVANVSGLLQAGPPPTDAAHVAAGIHHEPVHAPEPTASTGVEQTQLAPESAPEQQSAEAQPLLKEASRPPRRKRSWPIVLVGCLIAVIAIVAIAAWFGQPPTIKVTPLSQAQEQALKPKATFQECSQCPTMVVVPAGSFTMGSPANEPTRADDEGPQHQVTIAHPFAVGKYDVTRDEFAAFVRATGYGAASKCSVLSGKEWVEKTDLSWRNPGFAQTGSNPVTCVDWSDAQAYVNWLHKLTGKAYRLLSESEWEYAARAGTTTTRYWGEALGINNADCDGCGSQWDNKSTAPVGSFAANPFGLYDMAGNVDQWVADCWSKTYAGAPTDGSAWTSGDCSTRSIRGGSWWSPPDRIRSAWRDGSVNNADRDLYGFRVARTLVTP